MIRILGLGSISIALLLSACAANHPATVSTNAVPAQDTTPAPAPTAALPVPTGGHLSLQPWRPEPIDDHLGGAIVL